ncbi:MAG: DUF4172 domain-containing protein, partial [Planctomycetes bacterium]|nr:DUF4172 domain-containing protein [Planctomycetota bacterium]
MKWNWQQPEWPNFYWDQERLAQSEQTFLQETGAVSGAVMHLSGLDRSTFTVELMTGDAVDTAQLEGEVLDRGSVQSSIQRQLGLHRDRRLIPPAEAGIAEMMVSNFQPFQKPLTGKSLGAWHRRILQGRVDVETLGCYRRHAEPMQIVSGLGRKRRVHFEAPPTARIGKEMALFLKWFNRTAPTEAVGSPLPVLVRAGIAHLWFESIHPFEDGNGRIGRAIAEKALMQGLL